MSFRTIDRLINKNSWVIDRSIIQTVRAYLRFASMMVALAVFTGCATKGLETKRRAGASQRQPQTGTLADLPTQTERETQQHIGAQPPIQGKIPFIEQSWVELGPSSHWIVRVATAQASCPEIQVEGHKIPLLERAHTEDRGQKITVCEGDLSSTNKSVTVMGQTHRLDIKNFKLIAVIGDTGCRIKAHGDEFDIQDCRSDETWPFARMLNEVILPMHPDLIVHVGDYHYRESECPIGNANCEGSIAGDTIESWQQDFFIPAKRALNEANWLFVRGNHEVCRRAGPTWFRFLDAHSYLENCADQLSDSNSPLSSTVGGVTLSWVDAADDHNIQPSLNQLSKTLRLKSFLFMHRPFLIPGEDPEATTNNHLPVSLQKRGMITALIVGHRHKFEMSRFNDGRPPELITGNGGTKLLVPEAGLRIKDGWSAKSEKSVAQSTYWRHGFLTLQKQSLKKGSKKEPGWLAVEHDVDGKPVFTSPL